MKRFHRVGIGMVMLGGVAMASSSMSLTQFKPRVMPVLVAVNARARVTKVLPANRPSPKSMLLLPYGAAAYWVWKDGDQLALVSDSDMGLRQRMRRPRPMPPPRMGWRPRAVETMRSAGVPRATASPRR